MANKVEQCCIMTPTLLYMMFSIMKMYHTAQDSDSSFPIRYRFEGNLSNLRRLKAKPNVHTDVLDELLCADV